MGTESEVLLRQRLVLVSKAGFLLSGGFFVTALALRRMFPDSRYSLTSAAGLTHVATVLLTFVEWQTLQRVPLTRRSLEVIDAVSTVSVGVLLAVMGGMLPLPSIGVFHAILAMSMLLAVRSVVVPSSLSRTPSCRALPRCSRSRPLPSA